MSLADQASMPAAPGAPETQFAPARWSPQTGMRPPEAGTQPNVGSDERTVSVASGAIVGLLGLARGDLPGLLIAGVGGALIYRGVSGRCPVYAALDIDTARGDTCPGAPARPGAHVSQSFMIAKSPEELYTYWRNLENLPRIVTHLESVRVIDDRRSHWVAKLPLLGKRVEWDAEITTDTPNSTIAWRSLPGADVPNSGSVRFVPGPGDRGTLVRAVVDYDPPGGELTRWIVKLFGGAPERTVREDLRNFKRVMEVGEAPTIAGQPHGTCAGLGRLFSE